MVPLPQCGPASEQSAQVHAPRPGLTREEQQGCSKQSGTEGTARSFGCTNWKRVSQSRTDAEYKDCERYRLRLVAVLH
jgi:hypothetical protein